MIPFVHKHIVKHLKTRLQVNLSGNESHGGKPEPMSKSENFPKLTQSKYHSNSDQIPLLHLSYAKVQSQLS